jgi:hypothetical protein
MISVAAPVPFYAIGQFYADFSPTSDEEVVASNELSRRNSAPGRCPPPAWNAPRQRPSWAPGRNLLRSRHPGTTRPGTTRPASMPRWRSLPERRACRGG